MTWIIPRLTSQRSMLLSLPAELRERIFEFALMSEKPLVTFHIDEYQQEDYQEARQPPLLTVSRQIRQEALPLFYASNDFIFFTEGRKADESCCWVKSIQPYLDHLRGVTFWIRHISSMPTHIASRGAIAVTMHFAPRREVWSVCPQWRWISPLRKHDDAEVDAEFLIHKLQSLVDARADQQSSESFTALTGSLRKSYVDHKMHHT
ncbi:hypothetical protein AMS68_002006 [Peltaster fructicola]|uniref:2EXR domain-containing protein n=1 Tax=Peltaster fructicola TaxID=286661 RepID=A0A6H0XPE2_9PEZI|nr:hypothetical protein AMS68_002006 [Peltaster fructicola]